jgi:hypothetical protein
MARFSFSTRIFRWVKATAAQLNDLFAEVRNWTLNSLSTDSLLPLSIDTMHHEEPLTYLLSDNERHIEVVAVGDPLVEVGYTHSATGTHKVSVFGFTWYRNRNGNAAGGATGTADGNRVCWYDSNAAAWDLATKGGRDTDGRFASSCVNTRYGCDHVFGNPLPGIGYAVGGLLFEYGGNPCMISSLAKQSQSSDWPPSAPASVTKYGVFGQDSAGGGNRDGQAQIWLFAEDDDK